MNSLWFFLKEINLGEGKKSILYSYFYNIDCQNMNISWVLKLLNIELKLFWLGLSFTINIILFYLCEHSQVYFRNPLRVFGLYSRSHCTNISNILVQKNRLVQQYWHLFVHPFVNKYWIVSVLQALCWGRCTGGFGMRRRISLTMTRMSLIRGESRRTRKSHS